MKVFIVQFYERYTDTANAIVGGYTDEGEAKKNIVTDSWSVDISVSLRRSN